MGLSERKVKQKIGNDPRNLAWSDDAARFGHKYLANLGWAPSTGLGLGGEGRTTHIAVAQKLDQLGIGAKFTPGGPDDIAWQQNKDFEGVLERLNRITNAESVETSGGGLDGDGAQVDSSSADAKRPSKLDKKLAKKERKKREADNNIVVNKADERADLGEQSTIAGSSTLHPSDSATPEPRKLPKPLRMAHRARFQASKRMAASSPAALSEILGISASAPTSLAPTPGSSTPTLTSVYDTPPPDSANLITTSSINMSDYFRQRILSRKMVSSAPASIPGTPRHDGDDEQPRIGAPRAGLGFRASVDCLPEVRVVPPLSAVVRGPRSVSPDSTSQPSVELAEPALEAPLPISPVAKAKDGKSRRKGRDAGEDHLLEQEHRIGRSRKRKAQDGRGERKKRSKKTRESA